MFFTFIFAFILSASVTSAQNIASCAPKDNAGKGLISDARPSASADGLITCVYSGAGTCIYFANASGLSSGSSDCPGVETKGGNNSPPPAKTTSTTSKETTSTKATSTSTTSTSTTSAKATSTTSSSSLSEVTSTSSSSSSSIYHFTSTSSSSSASRTKTRSFGRKKHRKTSTSSMPSMTSSTEATMTSTSSSASMTSTSRGRRKHRKTKSSSMPAMTSMPSSSSATVTSSAATMTSSSKGRKKHTKTTATMHKSTPTQAVKVKGPPSLVPRPTGRVRDHKPDPLGLVISNVGSDVKNLTEGIAKTLSGGASARHETATGVVQQSLAIGSALLAIVFTSMM